MKKYVIVLLIILQGFLVWSQQTKSYMPNIVLPSPESFSMTEYGSNSISEYNGKLSINVPIYNFLAGKINLPISLNYNGAGVKVNDLATKTGINWVLNAGGVVNRTVKDQPDEITTKRIYINENHLLANTASDCAPDSEFYFLLARDGNNDDSDTEVDVFNFNFADVSGSFYLDQNFNAVITNCEKDVKITIDGNLATNKTFVITNIDGVKYYFGGIAAELTSTYTNNIHNTPVVAITSYYLNKIVHPIDGEIVIEYEALTSSILTINKSDDGVTPYPILSQTSLTITSSFLRTNIQNPKYIKKIKSVNSNLEINFEYEDYLNQNIKRVLSNINIVNPTSSTTLKKVFLSYNSKSITSQNTNNFLNATRFFLDKIEITRGQAAVGNVKNEVYEMKYNNPQLLPARLTNGQDFLGYYNNKNNNPSLIPSYPDLASRLYNPTLQLGDRSPNYNYAALGTLVSIKYPTKGYSEFEYEPSKVKEEKLTNYQGEVSLTGIDQTTETWSSATILNLVRDKYTQIRFSMFNETNAFPTQFKTIHATLKITNLTTNEIKIRSRVLNTGGTTLIDYYFKKDNSYKLEIFFNANQNASGGTVTAAFAVDLFNDEYTIKDGFGVRLKRQKIFSKLNDIKNQYRYYYNYIKNYDNADISSMPIVNIFAKVNLYDSLDVINPQSSEDGQLCNLSFYSDILNKYCGSAYNSDPVYSVVTVSNGGDNFENGATEKYYKVMPLQKSTRIKPTAGVWLDPMTGVWRSDLLALEHLGAMRYLSAEIYNYASDNNFNDFTYYNGTLLQERHYENINNQLFKVKEATYNYEEETTNYCINLNARMLFANDATTKFYFCNTSTNTPSAPPIGIAKWGIATSYFSYYKLFAMKQKLISVVNKDYFEKIPLSVLPLNLFSSGDDFDPSAFENIELPYKKVRSIQTYEYGILKGLPTKIITTKSDGTNTSIVNTYVNQINSLSGITPADNTAYTALLTQNNVASPIQVQEYKNTSDLLSTQRTLYDLAENSHVLPAIIQTAKGNASLEDRIIFNYYDNRGNPTLVSQKRGPLTLYHYNLNNQVIAKIENFTGDYYNIISIPQDVCSYIKNVYPNSFVTVFIYDPITNLLIQTVDKTCQKTTYVYDTLHRLVQIKDQNENIIKEFNNNYRPQ